MKQPDANSREFAGRYGTALRLTVPAAHHSAATTTCCWVIDSPHFSPAWNQWALNVITLATVDDRGPAALQFQGATHEMLLLALNPEKGRFDQAALDAPGGGFHHLLPVNYCDQFEASDTEMLALAAWMVWGMVNGHLQVEPNGAYDRESWLASATKTLAHIRGEVHAP